MKKRRILITGAAGQIGSELTGFLAERYGKDNIVASDLAGEQPKTLSAAGAYLLLDVTQADQVRQAVLQHQIDTIIHLAALLSATGERNPAQAWEVNMNGTVNVVEVARENECTLFVPSSIAAFGPGTPRRHTPQDTLQRPTSMYGVTKVAGELLLDYYHHRFATDTRGVRYPGLISYVSPPGGGTTDYAVDIFYEALARGSYTCFLKPDTRMPMMYMPDALRAVVLLLEADPAALKHRNAFNIAAFSFTPEELAAEIRRHLPDFRIDYEVDPMRQAIADSWPESLDDAAAQAEWGWQAEYDLPTMVEDMLVRLRARLGG